MLIILLLLSSVCYAKVLAAGAVLKHMTLAFKSIVQFILGICFLCGIGFGVTSIFKFKQHKDNPQQNTIGTALTILSLSVALVYISGFYKPLGKMMFGDNDVDRYVAGPTGDFNYEEESSKLGFID